ncbi:MULTISPECIES: hypothetical protein [Brevibacillus]|nr:MULTISPECIES: hypothetical protein [Brevibacillus]MED1948964.1 hypothetical protein [Brevibacillus formosus]MED2001759.1 hypothetical protein [Brevibacillus formosus]MED2084592.1 hypothetical protein [Brevibacillus formosus]
MKDAICVGQSYHFWLDEKEDIYDLLYKDNPEQSKEQEQHK